jgi:hypothetical protein
MIISNDKRLVLVLAGSRTLPTHASAAPSMQEREWEHAVETKMEVRGLPFAMPTISPQAHHGSAEAALIEAQHLTSAANSSCRKQRILAMLVPFRHFS